MKPLTENAQTIKYLTQEEVARLVVLITSAYRVTMPHVPSQSVTWNH